MLGLLPSARMMPSVDSSHSLPAGRWAGRNRAVQLFELRVVLEQYVKRLDDTRTKRVFRDSVTLIYSPFSFLILTSKWSPRRLLN